MDLFLPSGIKVYFYPQERKRRILEHSMALSTSINGHVLIQESLLNEVADFSFVEIGKDKHAF